jgi:hypothetical protein
VGSAHEELNRSGGGSHGEFSSHAPGAATAPTSVVVPHLELADRLDRCVDQLVQVSDRQPTPQAREYYVDLMVGLTNAAAAMRGSSTAGEAASQLRSAIDHLRRVDTTGMYFPPGSAWRPQYP